MTPLSKERNGFLLNETLIMWVKIAYNIKMIQKLTVSYFLLLATVFSADFTVAQQNYGCPNAYSYYRFKNDVTTLATMYRREDGSYNNLRHPFWGSSGRTLSRIAHSAFSDYRKFPSGEDRPNPRIISNDVSGTNQTELELDERRLNGLFVAWGQFLTHDIDWTPNQEGDDAQHWPIQIPKGDPFFDPKGEGNKTMDFIRSIHTENEELNEPRQQINKLNSWFDGQMIYGIDKTSAEKRRTFQKGKLKLDPQELLLKEDILFVSGDFRVNENIVLTSLNNLFVREHNRICEEMYSLFKHLSEQDLYIFGKNYVSALIAKITYDDYLPLLLGQQHSLYPYSGYQPHLQPEITNVFSTAAFRFGHFTIPHFMIKKEDDGRLLETIRVSDGIRNPFLITKYEDIGQILKGESENIMKKRTVKMTDQMRNLLVLTPKREVLLDLVSLNIQRGRDHGLPDYNTYRRVFGLRPFRSFKNFSSNSQVVQKLERCFKNINLVDVVIGLMAEDSVPGGSIGELGAAIVRHSLQRVRAGDRFWYEHAYPAQIIKQIKSTTLADVIKRNTQIRNITENVFIAP